MFGAIENLREALNSVKESQRIFRNEMQKADNTGDNQKANFCGDAVNSLELILVDLKNKIGHLSEAGKRISSRTK